MKIISKQPLAFLQNLSKSYQGDVYQDNALNRKLGRVGQPYPKGEGKNKNNSEASNKVEQKSKSINKKNLGSKEILPGIKEGELVSFLNIYTGKTCVGTIHRNKSSKNKVDIIVEDKKTGQKFIHHVSKKDTIKPFHKEEKDNTSKSSIEVIKESKEILPGIKEGELVSFLNIYTGKTCVGTIHRNKSSKNKVDIIVEDKKTGQKFIHHVSKKDTIKPFHKEEKDNTSKSSIEVIKEDGTNKFKEILANALLDTETGENPNSDHEGIDDIMDWGDFDIKFNKETGKYDVECDLSERIAENNDLTFGYGGTDGLIEELEKYLNKKYLKKDKKNPFKA